MKIEKNMLIQKEGIILRVLSFKEDSALVIDCMKQTMPVWRPASELTEYESITEEALLAETNVEVCAENELPQAQLAKAHARYSLLAPVLPVLDDDALRNSLIKKLAEDNHISRRTYTTYLCRYLVYQDISILTGQRQSQKTKPLTQDQKNMRWALNKFYYTRKQNPLTVAYIQMLKEKYTDANGKLFSEYPTINQFRYWFCKTRKRQSEIISRQGMKEYELNHRPLLGDGVQEMATSIGWGMLDATICDIYLVDDSGNLVGRPVLQVCVDAYEGLCCGYSLLWEGGVYSVRELMLNTITDKVEWCKAFGITITAEQWSCNQLPGIIVTDRGSEFISFNFEQITELGCQLISLPSFSANLKGPVEKLFDLVQESFKPYLKGKGVIEPDFQKRGAVDYRKQACLTMEQFEKIVIQCIIYHNCQRILENFPFTESMLESRTRPYASDIWNYCKEQPGANLISVTRQQLILTLLPRTEGRFSRQGLKANGMRYRCEGYTEQYLNGGTAVVAYNPDDVSYVYLVSDGYQRFELIERRYQGKQLSEVKIIKSEQAQHIKSFFHEQLQAKIDLANHIEVIAGHRMNPDDVQIKEIRKTRKRERTARHRDLVKEAVENE